MKKYTPSLENARKALNALKNNTYTVDNYPILLKSILDSLKNKELNLDDIKNEPIILVRNQKTRRIYLEKPILARIGQLKIPNVNLYILHEDTDICFIDENVCNIFSYEELTSLGCKGEMLKKNIMPSILLHENNIRNYVNYPSATAEHIRSLSNGFKPLVSYPEIEVLFNSSKKSLPVTVELLKIVNYLKSQLKGKIEYSSRQDFSKDAVIYGEKEVYSLLGLSAISNAWLYDKNNNLRRPIDLTSEELNDEYKTIINLDLARKLEFKTSTNQKIKKINEQLKKDGIKGKFISEEEVIEYEKWKVEKRKELLKHEELKNKMTVTEALAEINNPNKTISSTGMRNTNENNIIEDFNTVHNQEKSAEQIKEEFIKNEKKRRKEHKVLVKSNVNREEKAFLNIEYQGHCQICDEVIIDKHRKYIYSATNLIRTSKLNDDARKSEHLGWNSLCLCPNCAAKFKYCDNNFEGFIDKIKNGEKRKIYFDIHLNGQSTSIFYSPKHLQNFKVAIDYYEEKDEIIDKLLKDDLYE